MSLRILFADDSVTAQNMGKRILTEAGYDVVAVSNGAAAVKKIAEQKPDIIILDVYMPGYTGLEVCEKVRGSMETIKTPVLLTVGKVEPFKPEEANRVRADGVIIKPFEASDLVAIVKKFEERIGQTPAPSLVRQAVAVERFVEEPVEVPEPIRSTAPQPTVEVPDHMATASAFSDLLGADSAGSLNQFDVNHVPPPAPEPPPYRVPDHARMPEYELPVSWRDRIEDDPEVAATPTAFSANTPDIASAAVQEPPAPAVENSSAQTHPPQIPVYQESRYQESRPPAVEIIPTASAPIGDVDILREPALQESAAETTRATIADSTEPGLMPTAHRQETQPVSPAAREAAELAPVETKYAASFPEEPQVAAAPEVRAVEPAAPAAPEPAPMHVRAGDTHRGFEGPESDFEARVAAAMAAYSHVPESPLSPASSLETVAHAGHSAVAEAESPAVMHNAPAEPAPRTEPAEGVSDVVETAPSFEYRPPVGRAFEETPAAEPAPVHDASARVVHDAVAAHIEAALPAAEAAAGAETGSDHHTIAQAVHRVMERLKPELVEEIVRELKSKK